MGNCVYKTDKCLSWTKLQISSQDLTIRLHACVIGTKWTGWYIDASISIKLDMHYINAYINKPLHICLYRWILRYWYACIWFLNSYMCIHIQVKWYMYLIYRHFGKKWTPTQMHIHILIKCLSTIKYTSPMTGIDCHFSQNHSDTISNFHYATPSLFCVP